MEEMDEMQRQKAEMVLHALSDICVPENSINYVRAGIIQGRRFRRRSGSIRAAVRSACCVAAVLLVLLTGLVGAIRYSPAFASGLAHVPILQQLVEKVRADRGIQLAAQHDYVQHVGATVERDGIEMTIDDIIADEWRVVLFYTLHFDQQKYKNVQLGQVDFYDARETNLSWDNRLAIHGFSGQPVWPRGTNLVRESSTIKGKSEFRFNSPQQLPSNIKIKASMSAEPVSIGRSIPLIGNWVVELPIDKKKFYGKRKTLQINQTVSVAGQQIHFRQAILYPTVIQLDYDYATENDKQIFGIDDFRLTDDRGREWKQIELGRYSPDHVSNAQTAYFESMYFDTPRSLTLSASRVRALDKNQRQVIVDVQKKKIMKSPTDRLKLDEIKVVKSRFRPDAYELAFTMEHSDELKAGESPLIMVPETDAAGRRILGSSTQSSGSEASTSEYILNTADTNLLSPLTFTIVDYSYDKMTDPFQVTISLGDQTAQP